MSWIPVEKQLPALGQRVLATNGHFVGEAYRHTVNGWQRPCQAYDWQKVLGKVTHWQPLPQAPNEERRPKCKTTGLTCSKCNPGPCDHREDVS